MALFTDFFPSAGDQIANNAPAPVAQGSATVSALVANESLTLTFGTALTETPVIGDVVTITLTDMTYAGVITTVTSSTVISIAITYTMGLTNGAMVDAILSRGGQAVISGDSITGGTAYISGDGVIGGDSTVVGDSTLEGDVAIGGDINHTGNVLTSTAGDINLGNGDTATVDIVGNTVVIGDTGGTVNVTNDLNVLAGGLDVAGDATFANTVTITGDLDLEGDALTFVSTIAQDHALGVDGDGIVRLTAKTDFGNGAGEVATWAEGNDTALIPAAKLPPLAIGSVHVAELSATQTAADNGIPTIADLVGYLNAFDDDSNEISREGDEFIVIGTIEPGTNGKDALSTETGDGATITLIYVESNAKPFGGASNTDVDEVTAADFVAADFHQLAGAGAGVTSITAGTNISAGTTGDVTISLDLDTTTAGEILYHNAAGVLDGANINQAADGALTFGAASTFNGNVSVSGTNTFSVGTGATDLDGTINVAGAATLQNVLDVTGNTTVGGTLAVTGATTLTDNLTVNGEAIILGDGADGATTINGATLLVDAATSTTVNSETITLGDGTDGTVQINGASLDLNANLDADLATFDVDATGSVTINSTDTGTNAINLTSTGQTSLNGLTFRVSGTDTANSSVITADTLDINATGTAADAIDINSAGGFDLDAQGLVSLTGVGGIQVVGAGISTTATNMEPLALVVGSNGRVMTSSAGGGGVAFDAVEYTASGNAISGDLHILHRIASDQTLTLPATPMSGDFVEISNLSGYPAITGITYAGGAGGAGMNTGTWQIEPGTNRILGQQIADTFGLDDTTASFKLTFVNANIGWVIIGAN